MNVLVTGGAGFIGSHIVDALLEQGNSVRVLDNFSTGHRSNLDRLDIQIVEGDIGDAQTVRRALDGMTHVVHQAAFVSVPGSIIDPLACNDVNVTGTLNVLAASRDAGIERVVFASSTAVYGEASGRLHELSPLGPLSPYGVSKLAAEKYCAAFTASYGLETVALRYFNVFGPRQSPDSDYAAVIPQFISRLIAGEPLIIYGDGEQTRDFVYVANVAQANLLALKAPRAAGRVFNIGSGLSISVNQLVAALRPLAGVDIHAEHAEPRAGDIRHSRADIGLAMAGLRYLPSIDLEAGLTNTLNWHREHIHARAW
jgi:nucleoside-diphosphate-sugar epimerase